MVTVAVVVFVDVSSSYYIRFMKVQNDIFVLAVYSQYCGTILQCCSQEKIRFDCKYNKKSWISQFGTAPKLRIRAVKGSVLHHGIAGSNSCWRPFYGPNID